MKKFLKYLITSIVKYQDYVSIKEAEEGDYLNLIIKVHPKDIKTVIGKNGLTIKSIRELVKIKAFKKGKRINIKIEE